jgi:hypothetical protein
MKTNNFSLNILSPYQAMKEITANNAITKIDSLLFKAASRFASQDHSELLKGEVIIDKQSSAIIYKSCGQIIECPAVAFQLLFVIAENNFYYFDGSSWLRIQTHQTQTDAAPKCTDA